MEENLDDLRKRMRMEALLEDKYLQTDIETVDVYITYLNEKKELSSKLTLLSEFYPIEHQLIHLKRVKPPNSPQDSYRIIIGQVANHDFKTLVKKLDEINCKLVNVTKVPKYKPLTRAQYEKARQYWPVSFFENKYIAHCLSGQLFKPKDLEMISSHAQTLLRQVRQTKQNVTLVADGLEVIAISNANIDHHFLHHSVIKVIDEVAKKQLEMSKQALFANCFSNENPLYEDLSSLNGDEESVINNLIPNNTCHNTSKVIPYLCTNYDAYMSNEACVMCAMALIHSRIKRLFFIDSGDLSNRFGLSLDNDDCMPDSALQVMKIHTRRGLNHHFEVFRIHFDQAIPSA